MKQSSWLSAGATAERGHNTSRGASEGRRCPNLLLHGGKSRGTKHQGGDQLRHVLDRAPLPAASHSLPGGGCHLLPPRTAVRDLPSTRKKKKTNPKKRVFDSRPSVQRSVVNAGCASSSSRPLFLITIYKNVLPAAYFLGMLVDQ